MLEKYQKMFDWTNQDEDRVKQFKQDLIDVEKAQTTAVDANDDDFKSIHSEKNIK